MQTQLEENGLRVSAAIQVVLMSTGPRFTGGDMRPSARTMKNRMNMLFEKLSFMANGAAMSNCMGGPRSSTVLPMLLLPFAHLDRRQCPKRSPALTPYNIQRGVSNARRGHPLHIVIQMSIPDSCSPWTWSLQSCFWFHASRANRFPTVVFHFLLSERLFHWST